MKKFLPLLVLMLFSLGTSAYNNGTALYITSSKEITTVMIDGRTYPVQHSGNSLHITDLRQGYHQIKLYSNQSRYRQPFSNTLIYSGRIYLRNGYFTEVMINRFGKAYVDSERMQQSYTVDLPYYPGQTGTYGLHRAMDANAFNALKQVVKDEAFDQTRVSILEQAIHTNYFETAQVKSLLGLITFESNRLALAKKFYPVTVDQQNFNQLFSSFTFSSSKEELSRFLMGQPVAHATTWDDDF